MPLAAFFATKGFTVRADARRAFLLYRLTRLGVSPEGAKRCQLNFRSNAIGVPTLVNETRLIARSEMGQLAQAAAQIEMMPDLGGNDPAKP